MTGFLERRPEHRPDLAAPPEQRDLHAALRPTSAGLTRWIAARKRASLGPIPAAERRSSRSRSPASDGNVVGGDGVDPLHDLVEREQLGVGDQRLPQPAHPVRGRLHRQQHPALQVLLRPLELAGAHVPGRDVAELARDDLEALDEVLLPRADVEPDLAGVRVLRGEAVDRVRHPTLLADLLEEPRGGGAAEDRVEQRRREAPLVAPGDARGAEADVVLLRRPSAGSGNPEPADARTACGRGGRASPSSAAAPPASSTHALVRHVARGGHDDVVVRVGGAVVRGERAPADGRDHVGAPDHGPPERMAAEDRLRDDVVHEVLRVVVDHRDLLEHDLALGVDVGEGRVVDHPDDHVERRLEPVVRHAGVDERRLARRGRVQLPAEPVEDLGDLLRRVRARALEEQVLDEVRHTRAGVGLVARAGPDPEAERDRADARRPPRR